MSYVESQFSGRDILAVLLVVSIWGFNFVPSEIALGYFTPYQLGAARFFLVAFPLLFFIPRPKIPIKWLVIYSLTQGVGQFCFLFTALKVGMTASLASVLLQCQIFFTALSAALLLGEVLSWPLKLGMVIAGFGLACFAVSVINETNNVDITVFGLLLTLCAACMWAFSNIAVRQIQATGVSYKPVPLLIWSSLVSTVGFLIMSVVFDQPDHYWQWLHAPPIAWASLLYLAVCSTGIAYGLWTALLTKHPASRVAPFSLGVPVVGMISGIVLLDEKVNQLQWLGSLLLMMALVCVVAGSRIRRNKPDGLAVKPTNEAGKS